MNFILLHTIKYILLFYNILQVYKYHCFLNKGLFMKKTNKKNNNTKKISTKENGINNIYFTNDCPLYILQ